MTQAQLERAVCRATGETREVIRRLGFQLEHPPKVMPPKQHRSRPLHHHRQKRLVAASR